MLFTMIISVKHAHEFVLRSTNIRKVFGVLDRR